ncbi:hypothetical protein ACFQ9X_13500 [Catenulispora yoronensis]
MDDPARRRDLRALPKADLHLHTVGAMRPDTLRDLAAAAGHPLLDPRAFTDFAGFQAVYSAAFHTTQTALPNLLRLVRELVEDAAASGAVWVQPHFDPHVYHALGAPERILDAVLETAHTTGGPWAWASASP